MSDANIKISVITAVYNGAATVGEALDSVLAQDYPYVESIVVDGLSTDGTQEVVRARGDRIARFVSERDGGIYDALNKGISLASGDVVGFLHADDLYATPSALRLVAEAFSDPAVDAVYGNLVYVNKTDVSKVIRYWRSCDFSPSLLRRGWMPPHPTLFVRRRIYGEIRGFDTSYRIAADYDSILRIFCKAGLKSRFVDVTLVRMRVGGASNRSLKNIINKTLEDRRALTATGAGGLFTLFLKNASKLHQFFPGSRC